MERNVLKERLMNKDDKNRHFVLLVIDISKHGAKEMGHVKMAEPGFVNDVYMTRFCSKNWFAVGSLQIFRCLLNDALQVYCRLHVWTLKRFIAYGRKSGLYQQIFCYKSGIPISFDRNQSGSSHGVYRCPLFVFNIFPQMEHMKDFSSRWLLL